MIAYTLRTRRLKTMKKEMLKRKQVTNQNTHRVAFLEFPGPIATVAFAAVISTTTASPSAAHAPSPTAPPPTHTHTLMLLLLMELNGVLSVLPRPAFPPRPEGSGRQDLRWHSEIGDARQEQRRHATFLGSATTIHPKELPNNNIVVQILQLRRVAH